jgi:hypothetical protein
MNPCYAINELAAYENGWDGDGAPAPNVDAQRLAKTFASEITAADITPQRIVADASGGIVFWFFVPNSSDDSDARWASIECLNSGVVLLTMDDRTTDKPAIIEQVEPRNAANVVARLLAFLARN